MTEKRIKEQKSGGFGFLDILLPQLMIPLKGVHWIAAKLHETAERELTDKSKIQQQLLELQMRYELEEIDDQEYERQEKDLLDQLEAIRQYAEKKEQR